MSTLQSRHCKPCEGGTPLSPDEARRLGSELAGWTISADTKEIRRTFEFKNYWRTMAFVNAVAWIAHTEDHHPDMAFGYKTATVTYWTHAINGLSENDFICAAKVGELLPPT